ncbi:MAG: glycosyltransferase [Victivallales bacterium]|nr:glycosyltransferase [Victivallales bacterium]
MRIALVSTYPPIECGIAAYSSYLVDAMKTTPNELHVISQYGAEGKGVYPAYCPKQRDIAGKIFDMVMRFTPDVVHVQHEFGLFGEMDGIAVLDLIFRLKSSTMPVVATLHTVPESPGYRQKMIISTMCRELGAIIVHELPLKETLRSVYGADPAKVTVIPHGARNIQPVENAKKRLRLEGRKVILLVGYFRPTKHFERMVDIFPEVVAGCPRATLVISGKMRMVEFSQYRNELFEKIDNSPVREKIEVFRGQFPQATFDTIISAADIVAFPYEAGAQSGVMAHAFAFGKPVVCSSLPAFRSIIRESGAGFTADSDAEYVEKIVSLFKDEELYRKCSGNALRYVREKISWDIVARETLKVYKKFDANFPRSRYIYEG